MKGSNGTHPAEPGLQGRPVPRKRWPRAPSTYHGGEAYLLRVLPYGESRLIATLFCQSVGRVTAVAHRPTRAKAAMPLEPVHTLHISLSERSGAELMSLRDVRLEHLRLHVVDHLAKLQTAGCALRWVRQATPARVPEPETWHHLTTLLDQLDDPADETPPEVYLAAYGLRLLQALGYGLSLHACICCGKLCELGRAALLAPARGGLVCRSCGGGPYLLQGEVRKRMIEALQGAENPFEQAHARQVLGWVEESLQAHTGKQVTSVKGVSAIR